MRLRYTVAALLGVLIAGLGTAGAHGVSGRTFLGTHMGGRVEVPGPGDPNADGEVVVKVNPSKGKLCYAIEYVRMQDPFAGHIHRGQRGEDGPIKFTLFDRMVSSPIEDCFRGVREGFLQRLINNPTNFYVNVHNQRYPDGAIRGQLKPLD